MFLESEWDADHKAEEPDFSCISWALKIATWADQVKCSEHNWWAIDIYGDSNNGISVSIWNNYDSRYNDNEVTLYKHNGTSDVVVVMSTSKEGVIDNFLVVNDYDNRGQEFLDDKIKHIESRDLYEKIICFMVINQTINW